MPELPEVETVARQLAPLIQGRQIRSVEIHDPRLDHLPVEQLEGRRVSQVLRLGKQVVLKLERRDTATIWIAVHLRMTGRLLWRAGPARWTEPHLRARVRLRGGTLLFCDLRRFGTIRIHHALEDARPEGRDPLERGFNARALGELLARARQPIKVWLLRQDRLVGLGNIYAAEILFAAGLDPRQRAGTLKEDEIRRLHRATKGVLLRAIERCGTTFSDFQDARGERGSFQECLQVYGRESEPCRTCGAPIRRIIQQQRSTFYCPRCQRSRRAATSGRRA